MTVLVCGNRQAPVDSGFRPAPLVEALGKQGHRSFVREGTPGHFATFIASRG